MRFETHIAFGFLVGLVCILLLQLREPVAFLFGILLGTVFPDIDTVTSRIGRLLRHPSRVASILFGHRGAIHSLIIPVVVFAIAMVNYPTRVEPALGFLIGYIAHLLLDSLTKKGVRPLWPLKEPHIRGRLITGTLPDRLLLITFSAVSLILILRILT